MANSQTELIFQYTPKGSVIILNKTSRHAIHRMWGHLFIIFLPNGQQRKNQNLVSNKKNRRMETNSKSILL